MPIHSVDAPNKLDGLGDSGILNAGMGFEGIVPLQSNIRKGKGIDERKEIISVLPDSQIDFTDDDIEFIEVDNSEKSLIDVPEISIFGREVPISSEWTWKRIISPIIKFFKKE